VVLVSLSGCSQKTLNGLSENLISNLNQENLDEVVNAAVAPEETGIKYVGYSKDFVPIKEALISGDSSVINLEYQKKFDVTELLVENMNDDMLNMAELVSLSLLNGEKEQAIKAASQIEDGLESLQEASIAEETGSNTFSWFADKIVGTSVFSGYQFEDFEKILLLNYKSMAYLLDGDRGAYNVTRKAIDMQNDSKEKFEKEMIEASKKLADFKSETKSDIKEKDESLMNIGGDLISGMFDNVLSLSKDLDKFFKTGDKKGSSLPSAYVNPFGYYISGVIQEFDSFKNPALRSNARISYKKANKLNKNSKVIKKNYDALKGKKSSIRPGQKLVHFIVGDGFAPVKKSLQYLVPGPGGFMPIKLPIYEKDDLSIARYIVVKRMIGKKSIARLSTISNIDAICFRAQKDKRNQQMFDLSVTVARTFAEKLALKGIGAAGYFVGNLRDKYTAVDTRSWLGLPSVMSGARLVLPKKIKQVRLIGYDRKWKKIFNKVVDLPTSHGIVYARAIGSSVFVNKSKELWIES